MPLKVLTNNSKVFGRFTYINLDTIFIKGHAKDVINSCYPWIQKGWRLAADPLAGYFSRPNPYHTIFLQKGKNTQCIPKDITRLERTIEQWDKYDNIIPMTDKLWHDYEELDLSIASCTLNGLLRNPVFYNCI